MKGWPWGIVVAMLASRLTIVSLVAQPLTGSPAPDFSLSDTSDTVHTLSGYRGSVVLLNFFATWCPECAHEMPALRKLHESYSSRGLVVLSIDVKEKKEKVSQFKHRHSMTWPVLLDEKAVTPRLYRLRGFPLNVVVDSSGTVVYAGGKLPASLEQLFPPSPARTAEKR